MKRKKIKRIALQKEGSVRKACAHIGESKACAQKGKACAHIHNKFKCAS